MPRLTLFCVLCSPRRAVLRCPLTDAIPRRPSLCAKRTGHSRGQFRADRRPCIAGATVEVTAGQSVGKRMTLTDKCDVWGDANGGEATFSDLTPDVPMTLRASATGYLAQEMTVVPPSGEAESSLRCRDRPRHSC